MIGAPASSLATIKLVTVSLASQVTLLPQSSSAVIITVVVPEVTTEPAAGLCVIIKEVVGVQLSLTCIVEVKSGTIASQLEFEATVWFGAQVSTTGAVVSSMVIT
ncbi:hypothetical protein D3C86_1768980 [compost metagenome]